MRRVDLLISLVVTVAISRPLGQHLPTSGLDQGWMLGINWARDLDLHFGRDVLFTYGPWGWLSAPVMLHAGGFIPAAMFSLAAVAALWWAVTSGVVPNNSGPAGRALGAFASVVVTPLVFAATGPSWTLVVALFALALQYVTGGRELTTRFLVAVSLAAALCLQAKFSEGVLLCCLLVVLLARARSVRSLLLGSSSFLGGFLAFWVVAGQSMGDLAAWLVGALHVTAGYPDAMQLGGGSPMVVTAGLLTVFGLLITVLDSRGSKSSLLWCVLLTTGLLLFAGKQAFTRQDALHSVAFFTALLAVAVQRSSRPALQMCRALVVVISVSAIAASGVSADARMQRSGWRETASLLFHGGSLDARLDQAREQMRSDYRVSGHVLASLGMRPVSVDPFEVGAAWAYDLNWSPVPILQPYSAYDPYLDAKNTAHLLTTPGMAVLREEGVVDDRLQLWDSPRYNMALLCSFRQVDHDARWTLFVRGANRCGRPKSEVSVRVSPGTSVRVPAADPDAIVTMSFVPDPAALGAKAASALTTSPPLEIDLGHDERRLPRALAGGPLIVRLPVDAPWPSRPDSRPEPSNVAFSVPGTVTFSAVRLANSDLR